MVMASDGPRSSDGGELAELHQAIDAGATEATIWAIISLASKYAAADGVTRRNITAVIQHGSMLLIYLTSTGAEDTKRHDLVFDRFHEAGGLEAVALCKRLFPDMHEIHDMILEVYSAAID